jgi:general secretion pathway protein G
MTHGLPIPHSAYPIHACRRERVLGAPRFFRGRVPDTVVVGFTLIEILVVVVILGILAAIVVPRVMERPAEARITRVKQDLQGIMTALNLYKLDNFRYPSNEQGLQALTTKPSGQPEAPNWKGPYLDRLPMDPWSKPYQYQQPGQHGEVDVYSYGSDGRPGGDGDAADIGNWGE